MITGNVIKDEADDIVANTPGQVSVHLNDLLGGDKNIGVDNIGKGAVDATENWWGCPQGPADTGGFAAGAVVPLSAHAPPCRSPEAQNPPSLSPSCALPPRALPVRCSSRHHEFFSHQPSACRMTSFSSESTKCRRSRLSAFW